MSKEVVYSGEPHLGTVTTLLATDEVGPGGGRHHYTVVFEDSSPFLQDGTTKPGRTARGATGAGRGPHRGKVELDIDFQSGPVAVVGFNGIQDEGLLVCLIDRLRRFQAGEFRCRENALALTKLEEALHWMAARKNDRLARGVAGKHEA